MKADGGGRGGGQHPRQQQYPRRNTKPKFHHTLLSGPVQSEPHPLAHACFRQPLETKAPVVSCQASSIPPVVARTLLQRHRVRLGGHQLHAHTSAHRRPPKKGVQFCKEERAASELSPQKKGRTRVDRPLSPAVKGCAWSTTPGPPTTCAPAQDLWASQHGDAVRLESVQAMDSADRKCVGGCSAGIDSPSAPAACEEVLSALPAAPLAV